MAILLVPMVAMVAFTIDIGRITMTTAEIQNAADAAALAGADQLEKGYAYYLFYNDASNLSTYETNARTNARTICSLHNNTDLASIKLRGADIHFGYTDQNYTYYPGTLGSLVLVNGVNQYPNTITVTVRRDTTPNGNPPITMLFGGVLGTATANAEVNARAILLTADLNGPPSNMLPLALDYNSWNRYIFKETNDPGSKFISNPFGVADPALGGLGTNNKMYPGYADYPITTDPYQAPSGSTAGFNGKDQLQVFPSPDLAPGNFGWLSMNNGSNSADSLKNWVTNGLSGPASQSGTDMYALTHQQTVGNTGDVLFPVKPSDVPNTSSGTPAVLNPGVNIHDSTLSDWKSIPGFKESDVKALYDAAGGTGSGGTAFLPLFAPANGALGSNSYVSGMKDPGKWDPSNPNPADGQNSYLNIVDYVAVTITNIVDSGGNSGSKIEIQPALVAPRGANLINIRPRGTGSSSYVSVAPALVSIPPSP
jgi:Flp pilus assembly protein TadG